MALYLISAFDPAGFQSGTLPLTAQHAYKRARELKQAGYSEITLTVVESGQQITDIEFLLWVDPDG